MRIVIFHNHLFVQKDNIQELSYRKQITRLLHKH